MDGYAFANGELQQFDVVSTSQAGDFSNKKIKENQAIRIFMGAYVPDYLDTVVMQDHSVFKNKTVEITKMPFRFANIRNRENLYFFGKKDKRIILHCREIQDQHSRVFIFTFIRR
ncbi:hypothetical protein [Flavobacterium sp. LB2P74]|uniref:hypothetical protein n=1 Tax=Flavobacterium sp. LB2P74 TaxID=3401717 RepID=UPI003AAA5BBC